MIMELDLDGEDDEHSRQLSNINVSLDTGTTPFPIDDDGVNVFSAQPLSLSLPLAANLEDGCEKLLDRVFIFSHMTSKSYVVIFASHDLGSTLVFSREHRFVSVGMSGADDCAVRSMHFHSAQEVHSWKLERSIVNLLLSFVVEADSLCEALDTPEYCSMCFDRGKLGEVGVFWVVFHHVDRCGEGEVAEFEGGVAGTDVLSVDICMWLDLRGNC